MNLARAFIVAGALLIFAGLALLAFDRLHLPLGRLPGDILLRRRGSTIYFPWVSCLILSVLLSFILWLFNRR